MQRFACVCGALAFAAGAAGQPVIDGANFNAEYGPALWAQNVGTSFGNATTGQRAPCNGSEIDNVHARVRAGVLYLAVGGNLESNFNKLDLFFDVRPGGQNKLRGDNPDIEFNGLNRMGDDGSGNGLTFDAGFEADYVVFYTHGNIGGPDFGHFANAAEILTGGGGNGNFVGGGNRNGNSPLVGTGPHGGTLTMDSDMSNTLGVNTLGNPFDSDPSTVFTGFEMAISLAELGWDGVSPIRMTGFVNGAGHDFLSNQITGGLPAGTDHLGEPRRLNLNDFAGDQWIVVPGPGAAGVLVLAGLAAVRRRRGSRVAFVP